MIYTINFQFKINYLLIIALLLVQLVGYSQHTTKRDTTQTGPAKSDTNVNKTNNKNTTNKQTENAATLDQKKSDTNKVIVTRVYNSIRKNISDSLNNVAGIGDIITIKVDHLNDLLTKHKDQILKLFINGRKMEKIEPLSGAADIDNNTVQFKLDRNTTNNLTWTDILGAPPLGPDFFVTGVKISVGFDNDIAIQTSSNDYNFNLIRIHKGWFWACLVITIIYLYILITMAKSKGLLRDRTIDLSGIGITDHSPLTGYSLGRFQMAFWFTLTIMSFFFIWLITDAYDIITTTILGLIGISAATSLSGAVIDDNKSTDLLNQTITLQNELTNLNTTITALTNKINLVPPPIDIADLQTKLKTAQDRIAQILPLIANNKLILTPQPSKGFFNDVLKDVNGVSFHRLQMLVWTFVLGLIFIYSVWKNLSMPEFGATLLALQGLTSGIYLGFKFPEKQA